MENGAPCDLEALSSGLSSWTDSFLAAFLPQQSLSLESVLPFRHRV